MKKVRVKYVGPLKRVDFGEGGVWVQDEEREVDVRVARKLLSKPHYFKEVKRNASGGRK